MRVFRFIGIKLFILLSTLLFGQENINREVEKHYFTALDHSTYIELILFKDGGFTYKYKFESAGIFKSTGNWNQSKRIIVLNNVTNVNGRKPAVFFKRWFIVVNGICSKQNPNNKNSICLTFKN